jgi:preprotein translocase subunit SecD
MTKRIKIRLAVIAFITLLSVYLFAGMPPSVANMKQRIHLGLDLQGGVQLVLKVKPAMRSGRKRIKPSRI